MAEFNLVMDLMFSNSLDSDVLDTTIDGEGFAEHPVTTFCERAALESARKAVGGADVDPSWDELIGGACGSRSTAIRKTTGIVVEKNGKQTWSYYHDEHGELVRIELEDPEIEGGRMSFDADGNETAAAA